MEWRWGWVDERPIRVRCMYYVSERRKGYGLGVQTCLAPNSLVKQKHHVSTHPHGLRSEPLRIWWG
jgi:hypothetical protein